MVNWVVVRFLSETVRVKADTIVIDGKRLILYIDTERVAVFNEWNSYVKEPYK